MVGLELKVGSSGDILLGALGPIWRGAGLGNSAGHLRVEGGLMSVLTQFETYQYIQQ